MHRKMKSDLANSDFGNFVKCSGHFKRKRRFVILHVENQRQGSRHQQLLPRVIHQNLCALNNVLVRKIFSKWFPIETRVRTRKMCVCVCVCVFDDADDGNEKEHNHHISKRFPTMSTRSFLAIAVTYLTTVGMISTYTTVQALSNTGATSSSTTPPPPPIFPTSIRQALLDKAYPTGSYSSVGWSNRVGSVLTPVSVPGIYTADRPFYWNNIDVGCRMTLIELSTKSKCPLDGTIKPNVLVHSPVALDGPMIQALQRYTVQHVVSPNYEHVKYVPQWYQQYPNAHMWACPGLSDIDDRIDWTGEVPYGCRPGSTTASYPPEFFDTDEIQPLHVDCEVNPFTGKPFFNEVVFYHAPSKTLLTTDLWWNYPASDGVTNSFLRQEEEEEEEEKSNSDGASGNVATPGQDSAEGTVISSEAVVANGPWELAPSVPEIPLGSRFWKVGMDKLFQPFYMNLMVNQKDRFRREICGTILDKWDVETIVPAHGDIIRGKSVIRALLTKHFQLDK